MKYKYKLIVADTTNPTYSKMSANVAQHLAVSFGYPLRNHKPGNSEVLVFDPNTKDVAVSNRAFVNNKAVEAFTADYLVESLENPDIEVDTVKDESGKVNASILEHNVTFRSSTSIGTVRTVTVSKEFVRKVAAKLAGEGTEERKTGLPVVEFDYPHSNARSWTSYSNRTRYVRVVKCDDTYLQGFELSGPSSNEEGTFKKYLLNRMNGNPILCSFVQS